MASPCAPQGRWRDLLPLPLLQPECPTPQEFFKESVSSKRHRRRREQNMAKTNEVINAVNSMAGFKTPDDGPPSQNQAAAQSILLRQIIDLPRSDDQVFQREAIRELLLECPSSPYVSGGDGTGGVKAYQRDLASLPECGAQPLDAAELIDEKGREVLERFESTMFVEREANNNIQRIQPYMDETLRSSAQAYNQFIVDIFERGMITFSRTAVSVITPFFVSKKNGRLRLVLDCRASNQLFAAPPDIALAAGYTFAQLEVPQGEVLYTAQSDVKDYFYSIGLPPGLRPYFALPAVQAIDLAGQIPTLEGIQGSVYPCMCVVPMGWSWSMWVAQRIHQYQASVALQCGSEQVLVDGRPPPDLSRGEPVLIPYADNMNDCGIDSARVQHAKDCVAERLREVGFRVHEEVQATTRAQALGFIIDGERGQVQPIPARRGKVRLALLWLAGRPRVSGRSIERVIGHCIHLFMLRRELLSIFRSVYDFRTAHYKAPYRLSRSAADECKNAAALLLVCHCDHRLEWCPDITVSDASLSGTAVSSLDCSADMVRKIGKCREMWRFKSKDPLNRARDMAMSLDPFADMSTVRDMTGEELDPFQLNLLFEHVPAEVACSPEWRHQFACRMRMKERITVLEGRGSIQAIRHKLRSRANFKMKHLHLGDNLGMVLAFDRGRAKAVHCNV